MKTHHLLASALMLGCLTFASCGNRGHDTEFDNNDSDNNRYEEKDQRSDTLRNADSVDRKPASELAPIEIDGASKLDSSI